MTIERLARAFQTQADGCIAFGAPFTAGLALAAKADIEAGGPSLGLMAPWAEASTKQIFQDAAPIRLLAAVHDLALSGEEPALAAHYPHDGRPGDAAAAWAEAVRLMPARADQLARFIAHEPQTNEIGRSMALLGGFLTFARQTGLPLSCVELGASAGLNQLWDRFHYRIGDGEWGDPASPIKLSNEWTGGLPPLGQAVAVAARAACDRRPVRLSDPLQRRRLMAYVWPEMPGRLPRLAAAIDLALAGHVEVEEADAVDFARRMAAPRPGVATVVYHSVFWQYMPAESQAEGRRVIEAHGAAATAEAPFAWLRMEPDPAKLTIMEVRLTTWPGGEERLLALSHPHGVWVEWKA